MTANIFIAIARKPTRRQMLSNPNTKYMKAILLDLDDDGPYSHSDEWCLDVIYYACIGHDDDGDESTPYSVWYRKAGDQSKDPILMIHEKMVYHYDSCIDH